MGKHVAEKQKGGALAPWEKELAKLAEQQAAGEQMPGGQFLSVRAGQLTLAGQPIKGNELDVVIIDHIFENTFYEGKFDADNPSSPVCFAFNRDQEALAPHKDSAKPQHDQCAGCPQNEFGTADTGKGKACKNSRRIALISGSDLSSGSIKEGEIVFFKIPVTSVKGWAYYLKSLNATYKRPPFGVITTLAVVPDPNTQLRVTFTMKELVDKKLIAAVMARRTAVMESIMFPYAKPSENRPTRGKVNKKSNARNKAGRKF